MISVEDAMQQIKRGTDEILVESELQEPRPYRTDQ